MRRMCFIDEAQFGVFRAVEWSLVKVNSFTACPAAVLWEEEKAAVVNSPA
jgi:hypothetical protein